MSEPFKVERTTRQVIEGKMLESIGAGEHVAILASKQDLEDFIAALLVAIDNLPVSDRGTRMISLLNDLEQLRKEAFGT